MNQNWSLTANDWINYDQTNYHYNSYKLLDTLVVQRWDTTGGSWLNYQRSVYFYSEPFGISEVSNGKHLCDFANPMKTGSMINCPGFASGTVYHLKIYSLSGTLVYSNMFVGGNSVSMSATVPDGLYLMQFTGENGQVLSTNKVMILK